MKTFEPQALKNILDLHRKWVLNGSDGKRANLSSADLSSADLRSANLRSADLRYANLRSADLSSADLRYANLRSADLRYADLRSADLRYADLRSADLSSADLRYADLRYANLRYANLRYANLSSADLSDIVEDLYKVLDLAKAEVPELYRSIWDGRINGSAYEGDCACLVGTIANARHQNYKKLEGLVPNSDRLSEKWFLGIQKGECPINSEVAKVTAGWIEEYMDKNGIKKPVRLVVWS